MTDVIAKLKAERAALQGRLAKLEAAIDEYERWAQSVAELVGGETATRVTESRTVTHGPQTPMAIFEREVRALFERASKPLTRGEVADALENAEVVVGGKEPLNTVASRLSRMGGITNLKGFGYWLEGRPYEPAGYTGATVATAEMPDRAETDDEFALMGGDAPSART